MSADPACCLSPPHPDSPGAPALAADARRLADEFNTSCFCITLDRTAMAQAMEDASATPDFYRTHIASREHMFANVPVFLPEADLEAMMAVVQAIEHTTRQPGYTAAAMSWAPDIARRNPGPAGAFMGYDFHLGCGPPRLIEVNTNAGGAFLNAISAQAQLACCDAVARTESFPTIADFESDVIAMFTAEWRRQRGGRPRTIAIVDDAPQDQYLYPEFLLAQQMFERHGVRAIVADPGDLAFTDGVLTHRGETVDLVYNRLVDFALSDPAHAALRAAYESDAVVVTPNPHIHARFADKRNLTLLTNPEILNDWQTGPATAEALATIPQAVRVTPENADQLWTNRKNYFFKPVAGYGGRAVYRGDKVTRTVWANILGADYIAQQIAPPGERQVQVRDAVLPRKVDVRLYTYEGRLLLAAARLYQGQTTNFRTEGGGFAPVYFL